MSTIIILSACAEYSSSNDTPSSVNKQKEYAGKAPTRFPLCVLLAVSRQIGNAVAPRISSTTLIPGNTLKIGSSPASVSDGLGRLSILYHFFGGTVGLTMDASLSVYGSLLSDRPSTTSSMQEIFFRNAFSTEKTKTDEKINDIETRHHENSDTTTVSIATENLRIFDPVQLRKLSIRACNNVSYDSLIYLKNYTNIQVLDLGFSDITDEGKELETIICPNLIHLRELDLYHCYGVGTESCAAIAKHLKFLKVLSLRQCDDHIYDSAVKALGNPEKSVLCDCLEKLDLSHNTGLTYAAVLEHIAPNMKMLRSLDLFSIGSWSTSSVFRPVTDEDEKEKGSSGDKQDNDVFMSLDLVDPRKCIFASQLEEISNFLVETGNGARRNCLGEMLQRISKNVHCLKKLSFSYFFQSDRNKNGWPVKEKILLKKFFMQPNIHENLVELSLKSCGLKDDAVMKTILALDERNTFLLLRKLEVLDISQQNDLTPAVLDELKKIGEGKLSVLRRVTMTRTQNFARAVQTDSAMLYYGNILVKFGY